MSPSVDRELAEFAPIERAILARRGIGSRQAAASFLERSSDQSEDPFQMADMRAAVDRLLRAREQEQQVVVYGDYDADGTSATALLVSALEAAGLQVSWYVPNRFREGYGLNRAALKELADRGAELVVTVDCGIRASAVVQSSPVEIIVTDHHLPGSSLPPATAVLNPHRDDDAYPFKGLCGVGIAYKLGQALLQEVGVDVDGNLLDLVAVGTVADLAPLEAENRALVWAGLEQLNRAARPGLRALSEYAGYRQGALNADSIGYGLGPRLNAAGRLADAGEAVRLLLAPAGPQAWERAAALDALNRDRRLLTSETVAQAQELAARERLAENLVLAIGEGFHEGVVGLVASRLAEQAYRPALVGVRDGSTIKGSARSIPEFHITQALDQCADLLVRYGGHAQAAGFTLEAHNLPQFAARMDAAAAAAFAEVEPVPTLEIDAKLEFPQLGEELMQFIDSLEPCGQGNPHPLFQSDGVVVLSKRAVGANRRHLKLSLRQRGAVFDAIAFGMGERLAELPRLVDVVYRLERNEFRGVVSLQLNVQDLRPSQRSASN